MQISYNLDVNVCRYKFERIQVAYAVKIEPTEADWLKPISVFLHAHERTILYQ